MKQPVNPHQPHHTAEPNVRKARALRQNLGPRPQNLRTQLESESPRGVGKDAGRLLEEVVTSPALRIPRAQQLMVSSYITASPEKSVENPRKNL